MQCVLIISVFALTTAGPPANNWPLTGLDRTNDLRNLFLQGNVPVRQGATFPQNGYTNNVNNFGNSPFARLSGVNPQQNQPPALPVNNIQWLPVIPNNNAYPFLQPVKNQNDPNFQRALNNFINIQPNNLNGITNKGYVQQRLGQPGLIQAVGRGLDKKPPRSSPAYINGVPQQNQVQYITYTTPESAQVVQRNVQSAVLNMKQAYPQVTNQNTVPTLIELDFNPKNPFNPNQGNNIQQNQIPRRPDSQTNGFGAPSVQPVINFDINFNTPYPQNSQSAAPINNQQFAQTPQIPLPPSNNPNNKIAPNSLSNLDFDPNHPFHKNYRDDITHEPAIFTNDDPHFDTEKVPPVKRLEHEKAPISIHEDPPEVPTRPIYPGQGKWAKPGLKHRPHISPHNLGPVEKYETKGIPDGYDTFLEGHKLFDFHNNQFGKKSQEFPQRQPIDTGVQINRPNPPRSYEQENTENPLEEDTEPFVPSRLYAQIRQTEDEKHLPPAADENGKLKELVKDSKTHTIYSEEGYEDLAYDHAGHEKNAENTEGYKKDRKEVVDEKIKNEPQKKYNFHLPQREIKSYSTGDELTEDDFQKLKEESLRLDDDDDEDDDNDNDDSETEATEYDKSVITKVKPPKKVYSAKTTDSSRYKVKVDDFIEAKDSNPISAIVKGDGNTEIEISSQVKVIVQPNNTTKSHKYVKIFPKFTKTLKNEGEVKPIKIEINKNVDVTKTTTTEVPFTTITPTIEEIFTVEIPATTQATTAIPKISTSSPHNVNNRRKREAYYLPKIEVDTDFIDKINHTLPPIPSKKEIIKAKFPYYYDFKNVGIHENSPLRYSEHPKNIPLKTGDGNLAFYNQADKKKECSEVNPVVDPVPERIKEANENTEEESDVAELAESPRLGQLGDKIDCFKSKYFGENPLDNPLFQEELVGPVEPIFKEIQTITKQALVNPIIKQVSPKHLKVYKNAQRQSRDIKDSTSNNFYNSPIDYKNDNLELSEEYEAHTNSNPDDNDEKEDDEIIKSDKPTKEIDNHITEKNPKEDAETVDVANIHTIKESHSEVNTLAPATLITTPKYTIDLKPKHIYDQIELLQYLPLEETDTSTEKSVTQNPKDSSDEKRKLSKAKSRIKEKKYYLDKTTENNKAATDKSIDSNKRSSDDNKIFERYSLFEETEKPEIKLKEIHVEIIDDNEGLNELSKKGTETTFTYEPKLTFNSDKKGKKKAKGNLDGAPTRAKAKGLYEKRTGRVLKDQKIFTDIETSTEPVEFLPVPKPLKRHRRLRKRSRFPFIFDINPYIPKIPVARPPYHDPILTPRTAYLSEDIEDDSVTETVFEIFDINKFLPTTETIGDETNVLPKYKSMSEVFYKDDIKPNEQLNVFTDVFNHIKNSPYEQDMFNSASEPVAVRVKPADSTKGTKNIGYQRSTTISPSRHRNVYKNHQVLDPNKTSRDEPITKKRRRSTTTTRSIFLSDVHKNHKTYDSKNPLGEDLERIRSHHITSHTTKKPTTTKTLPESIEDKEEEEKEESTDVMGLVPPNVHGYKTIYNPKRDNSPDTANEGVVEEKKMNKFIVPGMKPPPKRRVYNYSDYLTANHIRQKPKRSRRSAARPAYAEVTRHRDVTRSRDVTERPEKNDTKKDDDDYVPHRPQNYHYDEETGKIIYDKKPEVPDESEEIEYIEVLDELPSSTTDKPKQNPIFATATPPPQGESYTDFVKLLKSASNYHEIPDPTTTEKGNESSTTEAVPSTTLKAVSTLPPEFLSILAKVRNDTNYKVIEDKKKTKATTTTQPPEEYIEDAVDGESQVQPVKNSPGSMGIVNGQMFKLFDITEFLPNVKSYMPKTPIDTSRYKPIQRPTLRHNLSSRYSSEEKDLQNVNSNNAPLINFQNEKTEEVKVVSPTIASAIKNIRRGVSNTATALPARTTKSSVNPKINRGQRRRVTTARATTTTKGEVTQTPDELTRNRRMQRRRNSRFQLPTTTTEKPAAKASDTPKVVHRRSQRDSSTLSSENKVQILPEQTNYRKIETQNEAPTRQPSKTSTEQNDADNDTVRVTQKVVDIFKNYDKIKRHRGSKKADEIVASENRLGQSQRNKIGSRNEDVAAFKKYDKSKKHGGNYREENNGAAQLTEKPSAEDVEIFKNYDNTKKHGGNYRRENENVATKESIVQGREPQFEESRLLTPKGNQIDTNGKKDIEVFKDYDKSKKHGGNYVGQDETKASLQDSAKEIEIFNNYDTTKKHGGNYIPIPESDIDPEIDISAYHNSDTSEQKLQKRNQEKDQSVIDMVFKPETFYSDPKLPVVINGLKIVDDLSHEDLEQIVSSVETGSSPSDELGYGNENEQKDSHNIVEHGREHKRSPQLPTTTKKPLFVKDPSQRLYFYAPLR